MRNAILLLTMGVIIGAALASKKETDVQVEPIELVIEKSKQTMQKASEVSARADEAVASDVSEMKQAIEVLEHEKEVLVQQVTEMKYEMEIVKSAPVQPFDVLAIIPDTAGRGQ